MTVNPWPKSRRWGKPLMLLLLMGLLMMSLDLVRGVVGEREGRLHEAEAGVAQSLSGAQTLIGPWLQRQCTERWDTVEGEGKARKVLTETAQFTLSATPSTLKADAQVRLEPLHRGIFRINGYVAVTTLEAQWNDLSAWVARPQHKGGQLNCGPASLVVAVGDARGLRTAAVTVQGQTLRVEPGTEHASHPRGFHAIMPDTLVPLTGLREPLKAQLSLDLVGTAHFALAPVGEANQVHLRSDWPHPSFGGRFLPSERQLGEQGFEARWNISALATTAAHELLAGSSRCEYGQEPASYAKASSGPGMASAVAAAEAGSAQGSCIESFGVALVDPVSPYQLDHRATRYGLLFVLLTWVGVGLVEVLRRLRVHPMQYLLVGAALVVFFLLLVSLSEHLSFVRSYALAAAACTGLLAFYGSHVLGGWRGGCGLGAGVAVLYATLYVVLQMEQTALLLGSCLVFVVLAGVMVVTRRVDWYGLSVNAASPPPPVPAPTTTTAAGTQA